MGNQQVRFNKQCRICNTHFLATGAASYLCSICAKANKYVKVTKGIYFNEIQNKYEARTKRSGIQYYKQANSIEEAFNFLSTLPDKQDITGLNSPYVKAKGKSKLHEFFKFKKEVKKSMTFKCQLCNIEKPIKFVNIHHKDHNRFNDELNNFAIWCNSCHRRHHMKRCTSTGQFIK